MTKIDPDTIAIWLGSGFISLLMVMAIFTIKDLYRRLRRVEDFREETRERLIAIELTLTSQSNSLNSMAISLQKMSGTKTDETSVSFVGNHN